MTITSIPVSVLREHWLHAIECDHEKKVDRPICACSKVNLGWHASVGLAVETWLMHLQGVVNESAVSEMATTGKYCDATKQFDCINERPGDCIGEGGCLRLRRDTRPAPLSASAPQCIYRSGCETPNDCCEHGYCRASEARSSSAQPGGWNEALDEAISICIEMNYQSEVGDAIDMILGNLRALKRYDPAPVSATAPTTPVEETADSKGDWQCKDYADGWITFPTRKAAEKYHQQTGAVLRYIRYYNAAMDRTSA